ncbi:UNVERIFIED_CONTAM: hypothetical protein GTU68_051678 [Idotea baltica]|nr:hypothetical protein [Idotea baltica]
MPVDTALPGLLAVLPASVRPYVMLARLDRPVGIWLLFLPCVIGLAFQRIGTGLYLADIGWISLFFIGAIAMRGAGCTWNDIRDRDIDASVARTASRPLPSGAVSAKMALVFLGAQLTVGLLVWLFLPLDAKLIALPALLLVAAYPFMKHVTWWPQAWLGLTMNWGILVGAAVAGVVTLPVIILYVGTILWTIAYDTIYALQDREDDALIGVRSTARLFGRNAALISVCFHLVAAALIAVAAAMNDAGRIGAVTALAFIAHGVWQYARLKSSRELDALFVFKSNVWAGAIVAVGFLFAALLPEPTKTSLFAGPEIVPVEADMEDVVLPFGLKPLKRSADVPTAVPNEGDYIRELIIEIQAIEGYDPVFRIETAPAVE